MLAKSSLGSKALAHVLDRRIRRKAEVLLDIPQLGV
jgi:hypothetical protein